MYSTRNVKIAADRLKRSRNRVSATVDTPRSKVVTPMANAVGNNPNIPLSPVPCSGAAFNCEVAGSGKTPTKDVSMIPSYYDKVATNLKEGGMLNTNFEPDFILNWQNNSVATKFTKHSLKATYGFENFQ